MIILTFFFAYAQAGIFTLQDAVSLALDHAFPLEIAKRSQTIAFLNQKNKKTWFLPELNFNSEFALIGHKEKDYWNTSPSFFDPNQTSGVTAGLGVLLEGSFYDGGKSITDYQIASENVTLTTLEQKKTRDELILSIMQQFYDFSAATAIYKINEEYEKAFEKQFHSASQQYQQGLTSKSNFIRIKAQLQKTQLEVINSSIQKKKAEMKLLQMINSPIADLDFEPILINPEKIQTKLTELISEPLNKESTYDFQKGQINLKLNSLKVNYAKQEYYPQLKLTHESSLNEDLSAWPPTQQFLWSLKLQLQWNIWDWGRRNRNLEIAYLEQQQKENETRFSYTQTQLALDQLAIQLPLLSAHLLLQASLTKTEEESIQIVSKQFLEGKVAVLDLTTSMKSFYTSQADLIEVGFSALKAISQYHFFEAKIYEMAFTSLD
jgi:outer membrane protein TolC